MPDVAKVQQLLSQMTPEQKQQALIKYGTNQDFQQAIQASAPSSVISTPTREWSPKTLSPTQTTPTSIKSSTSYLQEPSFEKKTSQGQAILDNMRKQGRSDEMIQQKMSSLGIEGSAYFPDAPQTTSTPAIPFPTPAPINSSGGTKATGISTGQNIHSGGIPHYNIGGNIDYQDDSEQRQQDIISNLNNYYTTNPYLFTDYDTFLSNFSYYSRGYPQQQTLERWWKGLEKQKKEKADFDRLNAMTDDQIATMLSTGELSPDGAYSMLDAGRKSLIDKKANNKILFQNANVVVKGKDAVDESIQHTLSQLKLYFDEAKKLVPQAPTLDPNYYHLVQDFNKANDGLLHDISQSYNTIQDINTRMDTLRERIKEENPWLSEAVIDRIYAREAKSLQGQLTAEMNMYSWLTNHYKLKESAFQNEIKARQEDDKIIIDNFKNTLDVFQQTRGIVSPLQSLHTQQIQQEIDLASTRNSLEMQYQFANPAIDSSDSIESDRALKQTLQKYYDQYAPIIQRDINVAMADIKKYAQKKKIPLSQALQENFVEYLRKKPEFQAMTNTSLYGNPSKMQLKQINGVYGNYNPETGEFFPLSPWDQYTAIAFDPVSDEKVQNTLTNFVSANKIGATWGECGHFVNNYLQSLGIKRIFSDPVDAKKVQVNSQTPTLGSVVVYQGTPTNGVSQEYGHVGVITKIYRDGTLEVLQSNSGGDQKIFSKRINPRKSGSGIVGYVDPRLWGRIDSPEALYDPAKSPLYKKFLSAGILPTGMKADTPAYEAFILEADTYSRDNPDDVWLPEGFSLTDPSLFMAQTAAEKKQAKSAMMQYTNFMESSTKLKSLVTQYGSELRPTVEKKQMQQLVTDMQLQAKELYNLGVLNGPDLQMIEKIVYDPTWWGASIRSTAKIQQLLEDSEKTVTEKAVHQLAGFGIAPTGYLSQQRSREQWDEAKSNKKV